MQTVKRWAARVGMGLTLAMAGAVPAFAQTSSEVGTAIETAANQIETEITALLPTVLGVAALLLIVRVAWRFFRRFVN